MDTSFAASTALIGVIMAIGRIVAVPAALLVPLGANRWGRHGHIVRCLFVASAGFVAMTLVHHPVAAGIGLVIVMAMQAAVVPVLNIYQQAVVPVEWRTVMSVTVMTGLGMGIAFMAAGGGFVVSSVGYRPLFLFAAGCAAAAAAIFGLYFKKPRGQRTI